MQIFDTENRDIEDVSFQINYLEVCRDISAKNIPSFEIDSITTEEITEHDIAHLDVSSKIEIAPEEYHIRCTYQEAILYCFTLNINGKTGWKLPTFEEWRVHSDICGWFEDRISSYPEEIDSVWFIIPVRDIDIL
jgi:hypothetical protein